MKAFVSVIVITIAGCSSSNAGPGGTSTNRANPCATKGATYLAHFVEQGGGTCGPVPDQILNINADGTLPQGQLTCQAVTQDGCTAKDTGCTSTVNGVTCQVTTDVTFASDGATATGLETETCTQGSVSCTSTYKATMTRQ